MISISNPAVTSIAGLSDINSKPIFFFDACALLDILRIPLPDRENPQCSDTHLIMVKDYIISDKAICLSSEICIKEFNDHAPDIINSYSQQFSKIESSANKVISIINNSGTLNQPLNNLNLNVYNLENYFSDMANAVIAKIQFIEELPYRNLAHNRLVDTNPPAHKKGEYKDCLIWETFYKVVRSKTSFEKEAFFISSNKQDYCQLPNSNNFHPYLENEVNGLNSIYRINYTQLFYKLRELQYI